MRPIVRATSRAASLRRRHPETLSCARGIRKTEAAEGWSSLRRFPFGAPGALELERQRGERLGAGDGAAEGARGSGLLIEADGADVCRRPQQACPGGDG